MTAKKKQQQQAILEPAILVTTILATAILATAILATAILATAILATCNIEHRADLLDELNRFPTILSSGTWSGETSGRLQGVRSYHGHGRVETRTNVVTDNRRRA